LIHFYKRCELDWTVDKEDEREAGGGKRKGPHESASMMRTKAPRTD